MRGTGQYRRETVRMGNDDPQEDEPLSDAIERVPPRRATKPE